MSVNPSQKTRFKRAYAIFGLGPAEISFKAPHKTFSFISDGIDNFQTKRGRYGGTSLILDDLCGNKRSYHVNDFIELVHANQCKLEDVIFSVR